MKADKHCPACRAGLVAEPIGAPLRCKHCGWHLITRDAWQKLAPFSQGYARYMQAAWPTSELKDAQNPYAKNTPAWSEFCRGEQSAVLDTQDSEE